MYKWITLLYTWNNIVNQLYFNLKNYLDKDMGYQVYTFIKTHRTVCLIPVHFTIYKDKSIKREGGRRRERERESKQLQNKFYIQRNLNVDCLYGHLDGSKGFLGVIIVYG